MFDFYRFSSVIKRWLQSVYDSRREFITKMSVLFGTFNMTFYDFSADTRKIKNIVFRHSEIALESSGTLDSERWNGFMDN